MDKKDIIEKLRDDEHYYGDFGKQYLSNSDISALLNNPLDFKKPSPPNPAFVVGGYFHTTILEPEKLDKYKIIKSSTRNTKAYKELAGEDICLLEHEADHIELMREKVLDNELFYKSLEKDYTNEIKNLFKILKNFNWKQEYKWINYDK